MKKNKFYLIILLLISIIGGLITVILFPKKIGLTIKTIQDAFSLVKNPEGTQTLPQTPETDNVINDLKKDIIENNK